MAQVWGNEVLRYEDTSMGTKCINDSNTHDMPNDTPDMLTYEPYLNIGVNHVERVCNNPDGLKKVHQSSSYQRRYISW